MSKERKIKIEKSIFENRHKKLLALLQIHLRLCLCDGNQRRDQLQQIVRHSSNHRINQEWLFGYDLTDTLMLMSLKKTIIVTSYKKAVFLDPIRSPHVEIVIRNKDEDFTSRFNNLMSTCGFSIVDSVKNNSSSLIIWAYSNGTDLPSLHQTQLCEFNSRRKSFFEVIKIVRHDKFSTDIETAVEKGKFLQAGMCVDDVDVCFPPILQSGGNERSRVEYDCIVTLMGIRYKFYCSSLVRTLMVNPSQELKNLYTFALSLHDTLCSSLVAGAKFYDVFNNIFNQVKSLQPNLVDNFIKTIGFSTGLEFRENMLVIDHRNPTICVPNMVFVTFIAFQNVPLEKLTRPVSVAIGDTVVINANGPATILTNAKRNLAALSIHVTEDQNDVTDGSVEIINDPSGTASRSRRSQTVNTEHEEKRRKHQNELRLRLHEEAKNRLAPENLENSDKHVLLKSKSSPYKSASHLPTVPDIENLKIYIDHAAESIVIPIFGMAVPFHISLIKNASTNSEGRFCYLRINFNVNISNTTQSEDLSITYGKNVFVKEMVFRALLEKSPHEAFSKSNALISLANKIRDLQKSFKTRLQEKTAMESVIKQPDLILATGKIIPRIRDLLIRPPLSNRKMTGTLEAHTNGFRYAPLRGDIVDILYSNIMQAFFQPPDNEVIIVLHFHLKHPILINKRKYKDVQFYAEIGETITDLGKSSFSVQDRDEIEAEQTDRENRNRLKMTFRTFIDRLDTIADQSLQFQTPFRELGFYGVPNKSSVFLVPTTHCLINIIEYPPFIVLLNDVELVHLERVGFNMKNFDMVFIFKNYRQKVCQISSIPISSLEPIKDWLDSCDIVFYEGNFNINWPNVLKHIADDLPHFFANNGWNFLDMDEEVDDVEANVEEEVDQEYLPEHSEEEYEADDVESDSENYKSEFSDTDAEDEFDSESGKSWSELEEEARQSDALKHGEVLSFSHKRKHIPKAHVQKRRFQ